MEKMTFGEELLYKKQRSGIGFDSILLGFLIVLLVLLVLLVSFTSLCLVDGDSMNDTLLDEQYVLLNKSNEAKSGDIIVFNKNRKNYIKRVVATGGETIRFISNGDGNIRTQKLIGGEYVDIDESYIKDGHMGVLDGMVYRLGDDVTIPTDKYFVMGDNRDHSEDSRRQIIGLVDKSQVSGKVIYHVPIGSMDEWLLALLFSSGVSGS